MVFVCDKFAPPPPPPNKRFKICFKSFFWGYFSAKDSLRSANTWYFSYSEFCLAGQLEGGAIPNTQIVKFCMRGRFCSLGQTHSKCCWNSVEILLQVQMLFRIRLKTEKKVFTEIWRDFVPTLGWKSKKKERSSPQFGTSTVFGRNWDLLVLTATFLYHHPDVRSEWRALKSR